MKYILVTLSLTLLIFAGCTTAPTNEEQPENTPNTAEENVEATDFQREVAQIVESRGVTLEQVKEIVAGEEYTEKISTGRTGYGGKEYKVYRNGEPSIIITYFSFPTREEIEGNYAMMKDSAIEYVELSFTDQGYYDRGLKKVVMLVDGVKIDVRGDKANAESFTEEELLQVAEAVYTTFTE